MLKLTYMENGFMMEALAQPLEDWVALRVRVAVRSATAICVAPTTASFLLPAGLPYLSDLEALSRREGRGAIALAVCDEEFVEVSLQGTWVSCAPEGEEGVFVTAMSDRVEFFLFKIWQEAQALASVVSD
jgi:hypothetical protein